MFALADALRQIGRSGIGLVSRPSRIDFFNAGARKQQIEFFLTHLQRGAGVFKRYGVTLVVKLGKHIARLDCISLFNRHLPDASGFLKRQIHRAHVDAAIDFQRIADRLAIGNIDVAQTSRHAQRQDRRHDFFGRHICNPFRIYLFEF